MRVFVLDRQKRPLMPCTQDRAQELLRKKKAAVFRKYPLTIILKERGHGDLQKTELKFDPGSKITGVALVIHGKNGKRCIWGMEIKHRGQQIVKKLEKRRNLRRSRRNRHTRYRKCRFKNRTRPKGWLPPSVISRVYNIKTWARRIIKSVPISDIAVETARFDTHLMKNPDIEGIDYQRGELYGFELKEYLLQRYNHRCAYCKGESRDSILEIEHIVPRSKGGSNRVSNLVIACKICNNAKSNHLPKDWLNILKSSNRELDKIRYNNFLKISKGIRPSLKDAAVMNAMRYRVGAELKKLELPINFWSGGRTKFNRINQSYPKVHWIDAACVGESGSDVKLDPGMMILIAESKGHGSRQFCRVNKYGFPKDRYGNDSRSKSVVRLEAQRKYSEKWDLIDSFKTGDIVKAVVLRGKKRGVYIGRMGWRSSGSFNIRSGGKTVQGIGYKNCRILQRDDGYNYDYRGSFLPAERPAASSEAATEGFHGVSAAHKSSSKGRM